MSPAPAAFSSRIGQGSSPGLDRVEGLDQRLDDPGQRRLEPAAPMAADVQDQPVRAHPLGGGQIGVEAGPGLVGQDRVRAWRG